MCGDFYLDQVGVRYVAFIPNQVMEMLSLAHADSASSPGLRTDFFALGA